MEDAERILYALNMFQENATVNKKVRGGIPVVKDTRMAVSEVLAEIADGSSVAEVADNWDLDKDTLVNIIKAISIMLDVPFFKSSE
jgi:uncharacterized protein (DUF433 family)